MNTFFKYIIFSSVIMGFSFTTTKMKTSSKPPEKFVTSGGLENIIVETYYISDTNDSTDTDGGHLAPGSVTYRIYVDMAPGYELLSVYATYPHPLYIATSTTFFNNQFYGQINGGLIHNSKLSKNTVALDSWLTMGSASKNCMGILKTVDSTGSIIGGSHNDGGSEGITGGLLRSTAAGIPLTTADGMLAAASVPSILNANLDLSPFDGESSANRFSIEDGLWAVLNGIQGPTSANQVLIAQITTTGQLTFELNVQLRSPEGTGEFYVASNPTGNEIQFPALVRH